GERERKTDGHRQDHQEEHPTHAEPDVLPHDTPGAPAEVDDVVDLLDVVAHQDHVCGLDGYVCPYRAHRDAEGGRRHRRGVVDAVADHRDAAGTAREYADGFDLLIREQPRTDFIGAQLGGDGANRVRMVSGKNRDPPHSLVLEVPHG